MNRTSLSLRLLRMVLAMAATRFMQINGGADGRKHLAHPLIAHHFLPDKGLRRRMFVCIESSQHRGTFCAA